MDYNTILLFLGFFFAFYFVFDLNISSRDQVKNWVKRKYVRKSAIKLHLIRQFFSFCHVERNFSLIEF